MRSGDRTSHVVVWDCTPGSFKWHYGMDETIVVISGEAFMINEKGEERRFGPGDMGFFPAGTSCTWRITEHLRKVGVLKENVAPARTCREGMAQGFADCGIVGRVRALEFRVRHF